MDWNSAQANWQQFKCEVYANWGRLTSGHLDMIAGRRAWLANKIEEAYGVTRDEAELQNLRLIALTANSEHPGRELAREAGIERYLIKPVGAAALDELFT